MTLDEDSNGEGDNSDGKNEVLVEAQCGEKLKQILQHVWTKKIRLKIVKWMVEQYDLDDVEKGVFAEILMHFCATRYNPNIMKASHVWRNMENILEAMKEDKELCTIQMRQFGVCGEVLTKAVVERGRKQAN
jgi:hypothetical protein